MVCYAHLKEADLFQLYPVSWEYEIYFPFWSMLYYVYATLKWTHHFPNDG